MFKCFCFILVYVYLRQRIVAGLRLSPFKKNNNVLFFLCVCLRVSVCVSTVPVCPWESPINCHQGTVEKTELWPWAVKMGFRQSLILMPNKINKLSVLFIAVLFCEGILLSYFYQFLLKLFPFLSGCGGRLRKSEFNRDVHCKSSFTVLKNLVHSISLLRFVYNILYIFLKKKANIW